MGVTMSRRLKTIGLFCRVSFAEYSLFYRALVQKRPKIFRSLLIVATPYQPGYIGHNSMKETWNSVERDI